MSRFACILVGHFAAAAHERCEPALRDEALAVLAGAAPAGCVLEANVVARAAGVHPGITEAEARARVRELVVRSPSAERMAAAQRALLEAALGVSPRVEDRGPGVVFIDLVGLARLFGTESRIAERLVRVARSAGLPATVGLAGSRRAARIAARLAGAGGSSSCIIPPGEELATLGVAPVGVLDLPSTLARTFSQWGVRTLGELAALPREGLAMRLGPAGLAAQDEALGRDHEPFQPWEQPADFEEAQDLDWDAETWAELAPVLERMLTRLSRRLAAAHVWADVVRLELGLLNRSADVRTVAFASPLREPSPMLALIALELEARPLAQPVTRLVASLHAVRVEPAQARLGMRPSPPLRDLEETLTRLATLVGRERIGSPVVLDSHRADAVALAPFLPPLSSSDGEPARAAAGTPAALAFRRLRPPRRVELLAMSIGRACAGPRAGEAIAPHGMSVRVHDRLGGLSVPQPVVRASGPWRTSGEWWDTRAWARDEWDVALADGLLCRLVRDRLTGDWWLDGAYD